MSKRKLYMHHILYTRITAEGIKNWVFLFRGLKKSFIIYYYYAHTHMHIVFYTPIKKKLYI